MAPKKAQKASDPQPARASSEDFEVDIRPDAAALRMFRNLSFTSWYALGEFVDNSISSYFQTRDRLGKAYGDNYTCDVRISFDGCDELSEVLPGVVASARVEVR